jgi:signal transduction histidine kinase
LALLGIVTYLVTAGALERRLDTRIAAEMQALQASYRAGGLPRLIAEVEAHERSHPNGSLDYAVIQRGEKLAGGLSQWPSAPGWASVDYRESEGELGRRRVLITELAPSTQVAIAADPEQVDAVKRTILGGFVSAFGAVLALGIIGAIALSFALLKRVETIRRTAEAIIAGDLSRRVPVRGTGDDLDRLSQTLNRMLDRIAELMDSLREVSAHIAHDLKTPLARLRQRLELAQMQAPDEQQTALEASVAHIDEILTTFSALLRIAQIEAGTRRSGFAPLDLSEIFTTVADAFAPAAEDTGKRLTTSITCGVSITGDRELLTQMLANVVENAIRHTPAGTQIEVSLRREHDIAVGCVSDNGPGVPEDERERVFHRFHRLEHSRTIPGSGLGLSLVKAVADIHSIALAIRDAHPGLEVVMRFQGEHKQISETGEEDFCKKGRMKTHA